LPFFSEEGWGEGRGWRSPPSGRKPRHQETRLSGEKRVLTERNRDEKQRGGGLFLRGLLTLRLSSSIVKKRSTYETEWKKGTAATRLEVVTHISG